MSELQPFDGPLITDQEEMAIQLVSEGKSFSEIAEFLEVETRDVKRILSKPQAEAILIDYYNKKLRYEMAPKALKVIDEIMEQDDHKPAKLTAALKVLSAVNVINKESVGGSKVFVSNTNVNVGGQANNLSKEQIAVIRGNLIEQREKLTSESASSD